MKNNKYQPLISVIVPVYNVEKYLEGSVESIINQSYKEIEIILVDDGSSDKSGYICDKLKKKDSRIRVFHKRNGGLSSARNYGIKKSTGAYLTFIDSDDMVDKDYVQYLFDLAKRYKTDISICPHRIIKNKKRIKNEGDSFREEKLSREEALKRLLLNRGFSVSACGKLYEKSLFNGVSFPEGKLCEDNGTTYVLFDKCDSIAYGNKPKYNYLIREKSITTNGFNIRKMDLIELTDEMCDYLKNKYPELSLCAEKRKDESRFSVLRQMVFSEKYYKSKKCEEIVEYLKGRKKSILRNPYSSSRDKIALIALMLGKPFFKCSWRIYESIFN